MGRATAMLPYEEQIPGERYRQGERVRALLLRVDRLLLRYEHELLPSRNWSALARCHCSDNRQRKKNVRQFHSLGLLLAS